MNDTIRDDIERYLAGGMSPTDTQAFLESVRHKPEALTLLGRALEDQAYLYDALRVLPELQTRPGHDTTRILKTRRSLSGRRPEGGPSAGWIVGAIAAGFGLLLVSSAILQRPKASTPPARPPMAKVIVIPTPPEPDPGRPAPLASPPEPAPKIERPLVVPPIPPAPEPAPTTAPEPALLPREKPAPTLVQPPPDPPKRIIGQIEQAAGVTPLVSGQAVEGPALVRFNDGTKADVAPESLIKEIVDEPAIGKRIVLTKGTVSSDVVKQPVGRPLLITTPHAVARVLGTVFKLTVDAKSTRLDVREGKVQLKRSSDSKTVDVGAGNFAVAGEGVELASRPGPVDEILLVPAQGEISGVEWQVVRDPAASSGVALEAMRTANRQPFKPAADTSRVTFVFRADANRDYYVWVRGWAWSKIDPIKHDCVIVQFPDSKVTEREGINKGNAGGPDRALYNGYSHGTGYWWVGGDGDGNNDEQPVIVNFPKTGVQTLRLYASEAPIRIDAIWISSTQKTRPDPVGGPAGDRK